ncbi:MAG: PilT/PilU family type 4a pilus ATPase [Sedimenticola sp.]
MSSLNDFLRLMVEHEASDLFFSPGSPLHIKIDGKIQPVNDEHLSAEGVEQLAQAIMDEEQRASFARKPEMNLGLSLPGLGRFRVNIFRQRGVVAIVVRFLNELIPSVEELHLPLILQELAMKKRGMVLMVGATGAGKSTSLASMIDYRNQNTRSHILTIEEPIEYIHHYKQSIVNQREVGIDTDCYADALKNAMREAPDVILIGEIRDRDTMQHAIAYAETGHLCLSTLHATNSNTALQRIVNFFPEVMHNSILMDLSNNLEAIVSQRLVSGVDGKRMPAVEVLLASPYVRDLIRKGSVDEVREAMEKSTETGMQSFDQSLFNLYQRGLITTEEAMANAESTSNLNVMIKLSKGQA